VVPGWLHAPGERLRPQERHILDLIADGADQPPDRRRAAPGEKTVKNHVSSLLHKLGFSRRARCASVVVRGPVAGDADVTMVSRTAPVVVGVDGGR
jgi:DNA-binding NarL/FixJ family response regulator